MGLATCNDQCVGFSGGDASVCANVVNEIVPYCIVCGGSHCCHHWCDLGDQLDCNCCWVVDSLLLSCGA